MKSFLVLVPFILASCGGVNVSSVPPKVSGLKVVDMPVAFDNPGIFKTYSADDDSEMNSTWTRKFDASGISFNKNTTCTLITPQHVVMASHYQRAISSEVIFHDRNGKRLSRVLVAAKKVSGDCALGLLNEPVPAGYKVYPLLVPDLILAEKLKGEFVLVTDQNKRLFVHEVRGVSKQANAYSTIFFTFDASKQIGYGKILVAGDSGNPSFIMVNGEPVLIETHSTGGAGAGPFYGDADLQTKLRAAIRQIGGKGMFSTVRWR